MNYEDDVVMLHLVSDLMIAVAYFSIPVALVYFARKRRDLVYNGMFLLFALFIVLCGTTHLFNVAALWRPMYRLDGVVKMLTGVASVATAGLLWRLMPRALTLPNASELVRRRDELERQVEERTADLTRANRALREADERKDEFLAMLAHELRNPLAAVGAAVRLIQQPGSTDEHMEWSKEVIGRQSKHLSRLIDDLLDVSRITRGKIELRVERLDAARVVASALDAVRPQIEEKSQTLDADFAAGALWCEADPTRLEQVLVNLLTNASRYTPAGGKVRLTARREGGVVRFAVKDDGIGIPPAKIPEMFELFAQGDRAIARTEGGLGIGLTVVKRIAELHGGSVAATSAGPGFGSEFTVTLPALSGPAFESRPTPAALAPAFDGGRARVLIVDDNVDTARGLARLLGLLGHEVRLATEGTAAVAEGLAFRPRFVLLDIGLPGMDGYQVARALRREGLSDAVIIAVSGYGQDQDRRRSREAGFDHHLVKPVDYDALRSILARSDPD